MDGTPLGHEREHSRHADLLLPKQLALLVRGNMFLVSIWMKMGMPSIGCPHCKRFDPKVVIPWLKERKYIDDSGTARKWNHVVSPTD
jgi:SOS response regulatory protein OraA/RecX